MTQFHFRTSAARLVYIVYTLLSPCGVLYMSAAAEEYDGNVLYIAMRNRLWNGVAVFFASHRRSTEAMNTLL